MGTDVVTELSDKYSHVVVEKEPKECVPDLDGERH